MDNYSFNKFKNNISNIVSSNNSYFWEVMLTDFYCFEKEIEPEKIYISQPINDGKIDSIIIPKYLNDTTSKTIYVLQISTSSKSSNYIEEFIDTNPFNLTQYQEVLKDYKDYIIHKALITFNYNKAYPMFNDSLEIICSDSLFECIFENSIRYNLTYNKNNLKQKYIDNIEKRAILWKELHRLKKYDNSIINSFIYFISLNHSTLKTGQFNLISNINLIWESSFNDSISTLKFFNSDDRNKLINSDDDTFYILMTIFRYGNKLDSNILDLVEKVNLLKNNNSSLKDIVINPTLEYLSIYYNNKSIAYLRYEYNKSITKSRFSFKCNFYELCSNKSTYNKLIKDYIVNERLTSTKEETQKKIAKNTGMSTTLVSPTDSSDDWDVISFLLTESIKFISQ